MPAGPLVEDLAAARRRWGSRPAVSHRGRTLTYRQVWEQVTALARAYWSLGVRTGDRIVCQLPTSPEHLIAAHAAWLCGAVHVGVHRDLTGVELAAVIRRTRAAALVFQPPAPAPDGLAPLRMVQAEVPGLRFILHGHSAPRGQISLADLLAAPGGEPPAPSPRAPDAADLLLLTSGTTGIPKLVVETLPALRAKVRFFAEAVGSTPDDVHLMYLPMCHAFGLKLSLMCLASGGRLVLLDRFSPAEALRLVASERVTVLPGTPTHFTLLLRALEKNPCDVGNLRWAISAAAPLHPELAERVYRRLGVDVFVVYGCSEGFLTATAAPEDVLTGSVGRMVFRGPPGTPPDGRIAVVDPETGTPLPPGQLGEIVYGARWPVRYWDGPEVARDGWYRTGDLGRVEDDGRVCVLGRRKEVINRGGLKVTAGEVEALLAEHPQVRDCAVIPTPDPVLGEAICACVVPADGTAPGLEDVRAYLGERLARHKLPDELCLVEMIPRSSIGKTDRVALRARVVAADLPRERWRTAAGRRPPTGA